MAFKKGVSGNPAGRPRGLVNRTTALEQMLDDAGEALVRTAIVRAKKGDPTALKVVFERLPIRKGRAVPFELPPISSAADLPIATAALLEGIADGRLTPAEAQQLSAAVQTHINALTAADISARIVAMEAIDKDG